MGDSVKFLERAYWTSECSGIVILRQDWTRTEPPKFFVDGGLKSLHVAPVEPRFFAKTSGYYVGHQAGKCCITFVLSQDLYAIPKVQPYVAGTFNGWQIAKAWKMERNGDVWLLTVPLEKMDGTQPQFFKFVLEGGIWLEPPGDAVTRVPNGHGSHNLSYKPRQTGHHVFRFETEPFDPSVPYRLYYSWATGERSIIIDAQRWLGHLQSEKILGAYVDNGSTVFRIFAPRAVSVHVKIGAKSVACAKADDHVWEARVDENCHGQRYFYQIDGDNALPCAHFDHNFKILDPYALAYDGEVGVVVDRQQWTPFRDDFVAPALDDVVIAECHVRDLLQHAPVEKDVCDFDTLTRWLQSEDCYLRKLGVNAVEFQPLQAFDHPETYHWGYMPVQYFCPSLAYTETKVPEKAFVSCQNMVKACHKAGLAVVLDVVYNHVGDPNSLLYVDKQYYFHTQEDGTLTNHSGCGNDLKTTTPMGTRLIVDSLKHWIEYYGVDGFRFDLADLIGVEVLKVIERELKKVKPNVMLIAEPWSFCGHVGYALKNTGFSSWNDGYREFLAQYVRGEGNIDGIKYFLMGSLAHLSRFPAQSINYVESHDDRCWLDKITENAHHDGTWPTGNDRRRTHMMTAILMSSVGVPMVLQGADLLHSKGGVNNTYQMGERNALVYDRALTYPDSCEYVRRWIAFRRSDDARALRPQGAISKGYCQVYAGDHGSAVATLLNADRSVKTPQLLFAVNPHAHAVTLSTCGLDGFICVADVERFDARGVDEPLPQSANTQLFLPPCSCYMFVRR